MAVEEEVLIEAATGDLSGVEEAVGTVTEAEVLETEVAVVEDLEAVEEVVEVEEEEEEEDGRGRCFKKINRINILHNLLDLV